MPPSTPPLIPAQHEQIKLSGLALLHSETTLQNPVEAYAEAVKRLDELAFQAHKTTCIPLKTTHVSTPAQIHVDVRKKESEEGLLLPEEKEDTTSLPPMNCEVDIEQIGENLWRVNVTPREDGN